MGLESRVHGGEVRPQRVARTSDTKIGALGFVLRAAVAMEEL